MKWVENLSNANKVACMGCVSIILSVLLYWLVDKYDGSLLDLNGFWTFYTLIVSSPVAFIIWQFRDKNATQQIENSRKDTNLKEFQKLAEWVSGAHFVEEKVSIKTKYEETEGSEKKVIEETREYTKPSNELAIQTYSKMDGAVGLQISAVYNLLPFYRGDHGENFRKPALNLLLSAWKAMQQKDLQQINTANDEKFEIIIECIREKGKSPLGVAITHTLLSHGGELFLEFIEEMPNVCLAGMDFNLQGLESKKIKEIFQSNEKKKLVIKHLNFLGANLQGIKFNESSFIECDFTGCVLHRTQYVNVYIERCIFQKSYFDSSDFTAAKLNNSDFYKCQLKNCCFNYSIITYCTFQDAKIISDFSKSTMSANNFQNAEMNHSTFIKANLQGISLQSSQHNYCNFNFAIMSHSALNNESIECKFSNANLCNTNIGRESFAERNNWKGAILFDLSCIGYEKILIQKGAIVIVTSEYKIESFNRIEFTHKTDNIPISIYDHKYTSGFNIDLEKTKQLNPDWNITIS